jgi:RNA polymerase sigma factor (sigma-70 family)
MNPMTNPVHSPANLADSDDQALVSSATSGDSAALKMLLGRQQVWIYNLAFYMLHSRPDAEDATQEILVKIATSLGTFRFASSFRTWARKIAVHHVLDFRRSRPEQVVTGFGCYSEYLDKASETDFYAERGHSPETALLVDEARVSCVMGMLLCLDRQQRVVFLLGEVLGTSDVIGAELLAMTRDNFRQKLHRARQQLGQFMSGRCGLLDQANPCRCVRKAEAFVRDRIVDPENIRFARGHLKVLDVEARECDRELAGLLDEAHADLRRLYPLFEAPEVTEKLTAFLNSNELRTVLKLN